MDFLKMNYIYPPRPTQVIKSDHLDKFENRGYMAQAKLNGSCGVLFLKGGLTSLWNRHGKQMTRIENLDFHKLSPNNEWTVLTGEYMNKSKDNAIGEVFNHKFVIWDIVVYKSKYLIGQTFNDRLALLASLYGSEPYLEGTSDGIYLDRHLYQIEQNIFRTASFGGNFKEIYNSLIGTDMYEGLVLKQGVSKLAYGGSELNNHHWQVKARKPTRNYAF